MSTLYKIYLKRPGLLFCAITALFVFMHLNIQSVEAQEKDAQIKITRPLVNGLAVGHPGTKVTIKGNDFEGNKTVTLFITPDGDDNKCSIEGDPASKGLQPFKTSPTVNSDESGAFTLETTWPDNAATPGTPYYICALSENADALSSNNFTVAEAVSLGVNPSSVTSGEEVIISGSNWLPPQELNIAIVGDDENSPLISKVITPKQDGSFSTTLTIPENAEARTYSVRVFATSEESMKATKNNALTVTSKVTPTAQPTATSAPPTPTPTPPPTSTPANTGSPGISSITILIFALGGLGVLLVIIGIILFAIYRT
jgi:hypothetical protein